MQVRKSRPGDWLAIETLHRRAHRKLPQLWWWAEHLADDPFIVIERDGVIAGALFAWPDDSPVAWVRLAVLDDNLNADQWLDLALPPILDSLRRRGTHNLGWMDYGRWARPHLQARGFRKLTDVITLSKLDRTLPGTNGTNAYTRPTSDADIPAVVAVDRAAFPPHWWYSEFTLVRRTSESSHFAVAEQAGGQVIGYAEGDLRLPVAHINRIAVHPAHQGHGVGALLLRDALRTFWRLGAKQISLNTQTDNHYSQRLYRRFGFKPTGNSVTAWELELEPIPKTTP